MKRILTGIQPTGQLHIGHYLSVIKPSIKLPHEHKCFYFMADYHALSHLYYRASTNIHDYCYINLSAWLSCGLDPKKCIIFRQSDIPELFELFWILTCATNKGLLERCHSYKDFQAKQKDSSKISMGVFSYPVLMAADILLPRTTHVPVGKDQIQHIEVARFIAKRLNYITKKNIFTEPELILSDNKLISGTDGQKMSKSYNNTIPLFCSSEELRKIILRIPTNSLKPHEPKDPSTSLLFSFYSLFSTKEEIDHLRDQYISGISWKEVKDILYDKIYSYFEEEREKFFDMKIKKDFLEDVFLEGAKQYRKEIQPIFQEIKEAIYL